jgi:hypothetical protein
LARYALAGDFNNLDVGRIETDCGLSQLVNRSTRKANILDLFLTNRPELFQCTVVDSLVSSDHQAVIVGQLHDRVLVDPSRQTDRKVIKFWDTRQHKLESLQNNLRNYSWNHITRDDVRSVDEQYNELVTYLFALAYKCLHSA